MLNILKGGLKGMNEKEVFELFKMSAGKRRIIKKEKGLCKACKKEYWAWILEDGGVLTFHGDQHGDFEMDRCWDEIEKVSKELREGMIS